METENEKPLKDFPKIDTIWSEAAENLVIKEEIISDLEPELPPIPLKEDESTETKVQQFAETENDKCLNESSALAVSNKKKLKSKNLKNEEIEVYMYNKLCCLHDPKNFKMVKRRLRCGDCRSLVCPECCKVMTPNLSSHFLGSGPNKSDVFVCRLCSVIFHSLCALQAHIRIHSMEIPYVCPDCGLIYNNIHFLILHLQNKCFHVYKTARYKCKNCPGLYFKAELFGQHVKEMHLECVFRCLYCSSLFTNHEEFNCHMSKLHQKQKAQYLNYYRCSLCSNMVIPQFMYEKHIAQHRDSPTFYEIYYQCVCGETFNVIGAFRAHSLDCKFKKILPYQWRFLQGKFKTPETSHLDYYQKDVFEPGSLCSKNSESEPNSIKLADTERSIEEKNDYVEIDGANKNSDGEGNIRSMEIEKAVETNKETVIEIMDSEPVKNNMLCWLEKETPAVETSKIDSENLNGTSGEFVKVDMNENMEVLHNSKENGNISKIYDHIPCDHLGYVIKTQSSETNKKTNMLVCEEIATVDESAQENFRIVTELDEKTGLMRAKSVPFDKFEDIDEDKEPQIHLNENDDEKHFENINEKPSNNMKKIKSYLIKCPFCAIMFPKHDLAFQQFKLHIDSNHPDAAINVFVSDEESTQEKDISSNQNSEMGDTLSSNDTSREQSSGVSSSFNLSGKETDTKDSSINDNNDNLETNPERQTDFKITLEKLTTHEKSDSTSKNHCNSKKEKDPLFWNVSILINSNDQRRAEEYKDTLKLSINNNSQDGNENEINSENKEEETEMEKVESNELVNENLTDRKPTKNIDSMEDQVNTLSTEIAAEDASSIHIPSEFDGEGDTSKNSSWSSNSITALISTKENKTEEKEKSRRESEVWSELYESLMLAEKLKKKKLLPGSESKRKSVVSDYSSKRIVKKPKRYGESSDSGESNENSDFDEFHLDNDLFEKVNSDEADLEKTDKDGLTKRQKLLIKLENVDGRLADYLLDLITKKEKMFELYKKHSLPRAGHDLRSYRRKVLNGIKHRGRPFKVLRCHDTFKDKYPAQFDRNNKEGSVPKKEDCSLQSKAFERKRGRPRKCQDAAKIKERRRSDKEVSFIEKNFEQDENELSPSKRKRKLSSKLQYYRNLSDSKDDFSSGQLIINKSVDAGKKLTCAVCKLTFLELNEFREHVTVHRTEENTYQCMECGECFVVQPSLEKHLHAFHKIKNIEKYIIDNQCCNIKKEEVEEEPLNENQCKVCKDQFEKASDLTKHFRIHGMAFLKEFKKDGRGK